MTTTATPTPERPKLTATQEAFRRGTPRWAENAYKAEATRSMLVYMANNYTLHAEAANTGVGSTVRLPKVRLEFYYDDEGGNG